MRDRSSVQRREVAVRTLGRIIRATGLVEEPLRWCPELMDILLGMVSGGSSVASSSVSREVLRTLGSLGAVDPFLLRSYRAEGSDDSKVGDMQSQLLHAKLLLPPEQLRGLRGEDTYPKVAFTALMQMLLGDPMLLAQDTAQVMEATMLIARFLGNTGVAPFIRWLVSCLVELIWSSPRAQVRDLVFGYLGQLVMVAAPDFAAWVPPHHS